MFVKLIDYYTKYQNTYIKHDAAVLNAEIDFVFEITSSFMKHQIRLAKRNRGLIVHDIDINPGPWPDQRSCRQES